MSGVSMPMFGPKMICHISPEATSDRIPGRKIAARYAWKKRSLRVQHDRQQQGDRVLQDEDRRVQQHVVAERAVEHARRQRLAEVAQADEARRLADAAPLVQADAERLERREDHEEQVHRQPGQDEGDVRIARRRAPARTPPRTATYTPSTTQVSGGSDTVSATEQRPGKLNAREAAEDDGLRRARLRAPDGRGRDRSPPIAVTLTPSCCASAASTESWIALAISAAVVLPVNGPWPCSVHTLPTSCVANRSYQTGTSSGVASIFFCSGS